MSRYLVWGHVTVFSFHSKEWELRITYLGPVRTTIAVGHDKWIQRYLDNHNILTFGRGVQCMGSELNHIHLNNDNHDN
jgi:hypothetical protein